MAVTAPPVEGKANAALIELLAEFLGVPKRQISIEKGLSGKDKTVMVAGGYEVTRAISNLTKR